MPMAAGVLLFIVAAYDLAAASVYGVASTGAAMFHGPSHLEVLSGAFAIYLVLVTGLLIAAGVLLCSGSRDLPTTRTTGRRAFIVVASIFGLLAEGASVTIRMTELPPSASTAWPLVLGNVFCVGSVGFALVAAALMRPSVPTLSSAPGTWPADAPRPPYFGPGAGPRF